MTALMEPLFQVLAGETRLTTDEWYTPRWLFRAADLTFDVDVCAPVSTAFRTCPAYRYLTVEDDGLQQEWAGVVWMNPPYSLASPWVDRWAAHPAGLALLPSLPEVSWWGTLGHAADALALLSLDFGRPDGSRARLRWPCLLAARGTECVAAVSRVAAADRYARGAYHVRPVAS